MPIRSAVARALEEANWPPRVRVVLRDTDPPEVEYYDLGTGTAFEDGVHVSGRRMDAKEFYRDAMPGEVGAGLARPERFTLICTSSGQDLELAPVPQEAEPLVSLTQVGPYRWQAQRFYGEPNQSVHLITHQGEHLATLTREASMETIAANYSTVVFRIDEGRGGTLPPIVLRDFLTGW